jgi:TrpR-related protein YerC/YecD
MTKVSSRPLPKGEKERLRRQLWRAIVRVQREKNALSFFGEILTPTEVAMLTKRLEVLRMLDQKRSYREIRERLKVMPNTITRMSNILHRQGDHFRKLLLDLLEP